jgi:hypothetical protein
MEKVNVLAGRKSDADESIGSSSACRHFQPCAFLWLRALIQESRSSIVVWPEFENPGQILNRVEGDQH